MDQGEEQLDYEDEEYAGHNPHLQTGAAISALADEEMAEDDEYDDLYHDVNVGFIGAAEQPVKQQHDLGNGRGLPPRPYAAAAKDDAEDRTRADQLPAQAKTKFEGAPGAAEAATKDSGVYGGEEDGGQGFARSTTGKGPPEAAQRGGESTSGPASARAGTPTSAASTPNRSGPNRDSFGTDHAGRHGGGGFAGESGGSMLFVGDLQWWTTDAELEAALSEYGKVKYMKFFEEKASGKSKGYCQVQFFEHSAARACKEGMNGRVFNGRPCVVAFANPRTVKQMGDAMANKGQNAHPQESQPRRMMNDGGGRPGGSFQGGEGARHYGARIGGGSARGPHGQNRGGQGGQGRGRGGMAGKNMGRGAGGSSSGGGGGGPYGQGLLGPMGGPPGAMMHPQGMMGSQGFDPGFGHQMGRGGAGAGGAAGAGGGYGGFGPHAPPFPGMVPSFPAIGSVALPGVAPHVNPAFFGRGMAAANGMGMLPGAGGLEGHHAGMWNDSGGWGGGGGGGGGGGDGQNRRLGDMGYGEDAGSEYGYGEKGYDRGGGRSNVARDRDRGAESDWAGHSEKRHRSEREADWERERDRDRDRERDRYREKERDGYRDQRERDRHWDGEGDWGKDRAPRSRSKSRTVEDDADQWPAAKESDYGKRRR